MKRNKIISILFVLLAIVVLFTGCSKNKKKTVKELTDFQLGYNANIAHMLGFVAKEEGFFQEEGINVTLVRNGTSQETVAALESGKLDAAFMGSVQTITNQGAGHDITIFGGAMTNGHGYVLKTKYIPAGYKEGDLNVLKGRNIAVYKNGIMDYELQFLLKKNGIKIGEGPDKVNLVPFASSLNAYTALSSNEIDGACIIAPFSAMARDDGHTVVFSCSNLKEFQNQPCCRQIALTSVLAAKPELYTSFERAIIKAYRFTQDNHEKTADDISKYITIEQKAIEYEVFGGHAISHPDPDKKATTILKRDILEFGFIDSADYDIDKLYNIDIYRKALAQLLTENPNDSVYKSLEARFISNN